MYTVASYLTYIGIAIVISAFLFAAWLILILLETGVRRLGFASRRVTRRAGRLLAARAVQPALRRATVQVAGASKQVRRQAQHAIRLLAERPAMRALLNHGATEHTH